MAFWSGQTLANRLPQIVSEFDANRIDCAAYTLSMGPEFYVTPGRLVPKPFKDVARKLKRHQSFKIPSGQFAFLLTEESLTVPAGVLAFISMRSAPKWRGLVNVSGFHVDPGFEGRLIFSVYNAGPSDIHLKRGDDVFLIWFADLDEDSQAKYRKRYDGKTRPQESIPSKLTDAVSGHIYSPMTLIEETRKNRDSLNRLYWLGGILITVVSLGSILFKPYLDALEKYPDLEKRVSIIEVTQGRHAPASGQNQSPAGTNPAGASASKDKAPPAKQ